MAVLGTTRKFTTRTDDLSAIVTEVLKYFNNQGYEATGEPMLTGGWHVSISKGGMFKRVLGMRTALDVKIEPMLDGLIVRTSVGIFGQQAIPAMIALFFFWPIMIPQVWGIIQNSNLDDLVMTQIEQALNTRALAA